MAESRTSYVYERIVRGIISGAYTPGHALNRRVLAAELQVSISPVNEALAILQTEAIVETIPRKGTFVGRLDWRDLTELTIVRAALESEAARHYCGERVASVRSKLLELASAVDHAPPVTFEHLHADIVFHRALAALAANRYLSATLDTVITRSLLLAMEATVAMHARPDRSMSHRTFVRELCRATPGTVGELVRRNVFSGKEAFLAMDGPAEILASRGSSLDMVLTAIDPSRQDRSR